MANRRDIQLAISKVFGQTFFFLGKRDYSGKPETLGFAQKVRFPTYSGTS